MVNTTPNLLLIKSRKSTIYTYTKMKTLHYVQLRILVGTKILLSISIKFLLCLRSTAEVYVLENQRMEPYKGCAVKPSKCTKMFQIPTVTTVTVILSNVLKNTPIHGIDVTSYECAKNTLLFQK